MKNQIRWICWIITALSAAHPLTAQELPIKVQEKSQDSSVILLPRFNFPHFCRRDQPEWFEQIVKTV